MTNIIGHLTNNVSLMTRGAMIMLEPLLGSISAERVLIFILAREEGYARDIARFFKADLYAIQKQLNKLETGGVLASRLAGRTRLYTLNPRYPFLKELKELLIKALSFYPEEEQEQLTMNRRRPRGRGKTL
jgi:predicted transcriptional regulator